jgi:hypothetical protein
VVAGVLSLSILAIGWVYKKKRYDDIISASAACRLAADGATGPVSEGNTAISPDGRSISMFNRLLLFALLMFNIAFVCFLDAIYVYSTLLSLSSQSRLLVQLAMATGKCLYSMVVIPLFSASFFHNIYDKTWFKISLLIFSNLIAPCIVTAFTSPSCFQGVLVDAESFESTYSYVGCIASVQLGALFECAAYNEFTVEVIPVVPPLTYNYICTSVLLSAYVPIFIYVYALQLVMLVVVPLVYRYWTGMPSALRRLQHGMLWPEQWKEGEQGSWHLLKMHDIVSAAVGHIALLLSFGLFFPALGLVIALTCAISSLQSRIILGRFLSHRLLALSRDDALSLAGDGSVNVLEANARGWMEATEKCLKLLGFTLAMFYGVLCWDLAGDDVGWQKGSWAPIAVTGSVAGLSLIIVYIRSDWVNPVCSVSCCNNYGHYTRNKSEASHVVIEVAKSTIHQEEATVAGAKHIDQAI